MRTIKGTMTLSIGFHNASIEEDFSFEVEGNATNEDIENLCRQWYEDFVWERVDGGWNIESDEKIKE